MEQEAKKEDQREQVRRDAERVREFLRHAEYFDSEDDSDDYAAATAALDRILASLAQAEQDRDEALRTLAEIERQRAYRLRLDTKIEHP